MSLARAPPEKSECLTSTSSVLSNAHCEHAPLRLRRLSRAIRGRPVAFATRLVIRSRSVESRGSFTPRSRELAPAFGYEIASADGLDVARSSAEHSARLAAARLRVGRRNCVRANASAPKQVF